MMCAVASCGVVSTCLSAETSPAADFALYNIVPFSPGREAEAAANAREYRDRTGGDIVLYMLTLHPEGRPAMKKAERYIASYRALRREMEGAGMRLGILVQSILGHWPRVDRDIEDWTRTVNVKGEKVRFCPDDPGFAKYIEDVFALIAAEHPAFVMLDDDVRAYSHDAECFCPRHVAEFNERRGTHYTERELREKVSAAKQDDPDYTTFLAVQRDMMERLVRRIRATLDATDPSIPAGVCVAGEETFLAAPLARAVAARGQTPVMRVSTGCYSERYSSRLASNVTRKLGFAECFRGAGIDLLDESDTCPHNLWSKSALSFFTHMEVAAFLGYRGAKVWFVNGTKMGSGPVSRSYTDVLARNRGVLDALADVAGAAPCMGGVALPCFTRFPRWHLANEHDEMFLDSTALVKNVLVPFGVPFRAERDFSRDGVYVLSSRLEVDRMTDDDLRSMFSHKVLVLGKAAVALTLRGRSDLIGLSASRKPFGYNAERVRLSGDRLSAAPADKLPFFSDLADGAETLSDLGFRPYAGSSDFEASAPSAVAWRNALGGRVVTTAFHDGMFVLNQMSEGRKKYVVGLLDRLCGERLRFVCGNDQDMLMLVRPQSDSRVFVLAVNLNTEPVRILRIRAPGVEAVSVLGAGGKWSPLDFQQDGEWIAVYEDLAFCEAKAFCMTMRP